MSFNLGDFGKGLADGLSSASSWFGESVSKNPDAWSFAGNLATGYAQWDLGNTANEIAATNSDITRQNNEFNQQQIVNADAKTDDATKSFNAGLSGLNTKSSNYGPKKTTEDISAVTNIG